MENEIQNLKEKLKEKKQKQEKEKTDWDKEKKEWVKNIENLNKNIKEWVALLGEDLVTLYVEKVKIKEDPIGEYETEFLRLKIPNGEVLIQPIGRNIIGAKGRADIVYSSKRVTLICTDAGWKIVERIGNKISYTNLDEKSFANIINSLIS